MRVLEKIKVIDLSRWLPGQYCGMVLGDFGAEVIKIDDIDGDATRSFVPQKEAGMSYWHLALRPVWGRSPTSRSWNRRTRVRFVTACAC